MNNHCNKPTYHHGNLRSTLLNITNTMLKEYGVEGISFRKLAAIAGVSRTAPYHHFKNKNALLCGIAENGFYQLQSMFNHDRNKLDSFRQFVNIYIIFAKENPELYDLMFGRAIWKNEDTTTELKSAAYKCFEQQLDMTREWQKFGVINSKNNALRTSQVIWGTVHGIVKLLNDGIYSDITHVNEISNCAIEMFSNYSKS